MARPELIYNIDEKGVRLTIHFKQDVLARRVANRVHLVAPEHAENVTVCSMATALFIGWLEHFARYKVDENTLLIFDGTLSHFDANIVRAADQFGIILYCLSCNTTHELQPLDKSVFISFESCWDDETLLTYDRKKDFGLNRSTLDPIPSRFWARYVTAPHIVSGFRATGIYPSDPHKIPDEAFVPSGVTEIPQEDVANAENVNHTNHFNDPTRERKHRINKRTRVTIECSFARASVNATRRAKVDVPGAPADRASKRSLGTFAHCKRLLQTSDQSFGVFARCKQCSI
ncbi:hypothetical protein PR048_018497 [Dryococelus australis]|uniref:DDE-1 domain-containing protein n=1 Tax=Dryococelus australis TaxID=614101 RepID=A0ABQ9HCM7_9NEOP|nr:hypothetical protein PR048_018497 [Dryococelus australis]